MRPVERGRMVRGMGDYLLANREEIAEMLTLESGKPYWEALREIAGAARYFEYYGNQAETVEGRSIPLGSGYIDYTTYEPFGVSAQIIPWNYPLLMAVWKLAPGLAAGNACILKPSEMTPVSAVKLFELIEQAGFPPGAANLVLGPGDPVGSTLAASDRVDKVAFTGGGVTGRKIMSAATGNLKKVTLELGGKSPNIVFADADFEAALEFAMFGIFAGQGEVCSAGSRLILERKIADKFLPRLAEACGKIVVGPGMDADTEMGPLISRSHMEKVLGYIQSGLDEGAKLLCGGHRIEEGKLAKGNFVEPTVFIDVPPDAKIMKEEIFGPVLVVELFDTEEEAIRKANDTVYGLAGAVFTSDGARAQRVIKQLRAGITWINTYHPTFNEAPWGGYKQSGIGRELGTYGYEAYTEVKQININLAPGRVNWFKNI